MKLTKTKLKQLIKKELTTVMTESLWPGLPRYGEADAPYIPKAQKSDDAGGEDDEEEMTDDEKLAKALHDILRHFLDEVGMENDEVQLAVEKALEVELGPDLGKILAQSGQS